MSYVLFLLAGFGFGYAAVGAWKFAPLAFPILLAIGAFIRDGIDGPSLAKLAIAIVVMLIGIALGTLLEQRSAESRAAGAR